MNKKAQVDQLINEVSSANAKLLGHIIWNDRLSHTYKHTDVVQALRDSNLDENVARKLLPKTAFNRACKKLAADKAIDVVKEGEDYVIFQITRKFLQNEEWVYSMETRITLNKVTGQVSCPDKKLEELAQKMLDDAMESRTTVDITNIIHHLFNRHGDLFTLREQGGVYFVPAAFNNFLSQVDSFVSKLGISLRKFPVPDVHYAKTSIVDAISDKFNSLIDDYNSATEELSSCTREGTMAAAAERIKQTRTKIEAYAHLLKSKSDELLAKLKDAEDRLMQKVSAIRQAKEQSPPGNRDVFGGYPSSKILKWMGSQGWEFEEAKYAMEQLGVTVTSTTIRGQLWCGKTGRYGEAAKLNSQEVKLLEKLRKQAQANSNS